MNRGIQRGIHGVTDGDGREHSGTEMRWFRDINKNILSAHQGSTTNRLQLGFCLSSIEACGNVDLLCQRCVRVRIHPELQGGGLSEGQKGTG